MPSSATVSPSSHDVSRVDQSKRARVGPAVFLLAVFAMSHTGSAGEVIDPSGATSEPDEATRWYDIRLLEIEGQGWKETKAEFDRFPARAERVVRDPVWNLSQHSAGMCVRFVTDATSLRARWTLTSGDLAMPHMPATGVSGVDLYVRTDDGQWRWLAVGRPREVTNTAHLVQDLPEGSREYLLYLPLYNGVKSVEIGIPRDRELRRASAYDQRNQKPILFYGTSITQGGCASRPGMVHTAILGRRLNRPVFNFGFSGNGRMELEVANLLSELDPAVYVLDCLPNMQAPEVSERVEPFVMAIRTAHPVTPILLVEDRSYTNAFLLRSQRDRNAESRMALRNCFERLQAAGVKDLHYLPGEDLLGDDGEATVDSSHPTDLGFMRLADAFHEVLAPILANP